jgi:glycerophosphoryl diester phosphodiesterase
MKNRLVCIGHRGAMGHEPENTLLSIEKALELGAEWVEVDVYFVDGQLIVIHDDTLDRTTNGSGPLGGKDLAYLRSLDAGKGQKIPLLDEVFDALKGRAGLNIELKGGDTAEPVAHCIKEQLQHGWRYEDILVSSFNHRQLMHIKNINPLIRIGVLIGGLPLDTSEFARRLNCYSVNADLEYVDKLLVDDAHRRGLKIFVYTVNEPGDIARMADIGVDGVFTDYPERVVNRLGQ